MKVLLLLLLVVLVVAAVLAAVAWARGRRQAGRPDAAWELDEVSDGEMVTVLAVHPANEPLLVGAVPFASPDFDTRIEEVRAEGRYKLAALNGGRRLGP